MQPSEEEKDEDQEEAGDDMKLSWTTLDMSSINDPEQLTGSSRVYANAKPGIIMEAIFHVRRVQSGVYHQ